MKGHLNSKEVRTVYDEKVARLKIDLKYSDIQDAEADGEDILKWLDNKVGSEVSVEIGPFEDDEQEKLDNVEDPDPPEGKKDVEILEEMMDGE